MLLFCTSLYKWIIASVKIDSSVQLPPNYIEQKKLRHKFKVEEVFYIAVDQALTVTASSV